MNTHTTRELTRVTKYDVNGIPYEATVIAERKPNYGQLWEVFKERMKVAEEYKDKNRVREFGGGYVKYEENLKTEQDGY